MKDILKIENFQAKTCKSCLFFRGEFDDKYLCRKPSSDSYLNDCFVNKKELDDLDFCVDYKYDYNKSKKLTKKLFILISLLKIFGSKKLELQNHYIF